MYSQIWDVWFYTVVIVFKLVEDDSEERRKSSWGELFRNNELSRGVFLSDWVIFICVAVAEVLNRDFYVLSFIKLMEDELEERRKSSRRELFRNNDCQKELFVRLSHSHLCGFNRCLESRISQLDECCAIIGASQTTPPMTNYQPISRDPSSWNQMHKTMLQPRIHMAARRWYKSTNAQNPQHLGMRKC